MFVRIMRGTLLANMECQHSLLNVNTHQSSRLEGNHRNLNLFLIEKQNACWSLGGNAKRSIGLKIQPIMNTRRGSGEGFQNTCHGNHLLSLFLFDKMPSVKTNCGKKDKNILIAPLLHDSNCIRGGPGGVPRTTASHERTDSLTVFCKPIPQGRFVSSH